MSAENYRQQFQGTAVEGYAQRLDEIVELVHDGDIDNDTALELIEDIKTECEVEVSASKMELKADLIKTANLLSKLF